MASKWQNWDSNPALQGNIRMISRLRTDYWGLFNVRLRSLDFIPWDKHCQCFVWWPCGQRKTICSWAVSKVCSMELEPLKLLCVKRVLTQSSKFGKYSISFWIVTVHIIYAGSEKCSKEIRLHFYPPSIFQIYLTKEFPSGNIDLLWCFGNLNSFHQERKRLTSAGEHLIR